MDNYNKLKNLSQNIQHYLSIYADMIGTLAPEKESVYGFIPGLGMDIEAQSLRNQMEKINDGIFQVLFIGPFRAGKSTLINALVRKEILPTTLNVNPGAIYKIVFGWDEHCVNRENVDRVVLHQSQEGIAGEFVQFIESPLVMEDGRYCPRAQHFIESADAIVYVIDLIRPFGLDERVFIARYCANRHMRNIFFVLNKFDQLNTKGKDIIKQAAPKYLKDVFTDTKGRFDEKLFNNRVFYAEAYHSLCARMGRKVETRSGVMSCDDSVTGVPELEKALVEYLTSHAHIEKIFRGYMSQIENVYVGALNRIKTILDDYRLSLDSELKCQNLDAEIERTNSIKNILLKNIKAVNQLLNGESLMYRVIQKYLGIDKNAYHNIALNLRKNTYLSQYEDFSKCFLSTMYSLEMSESLMENVNEELKYKTVVAKSRISEHINGHAPFRITFCGVFSAGKTSLINELLQCEYKLPTGINPITKVVTRIKYGFELKCSYYYNGRREVLNKNQTSKIIMGKKKLPQGCNEVTLELPAEILKNNIEILDTPGFDDEMGGELEYMSRRAIENADMVVLCCNALQLGKMFERDFITELESSVGNFCMAVTRVDCLNTEEEFDDIKRKALWLMQGSGNLSKISDVNGNIFFVAGAGKIVNYK